MNKLLLKTIFLIFITVGNYNAIASEKPTNTEVIPVRNNIKNNNKWYEGGTLHKSKISKWKTATYKNKLATCSDFLAGLKKANSMDQLKIRSKALVRCIHNATKGLKSTNNFEITKVAINCIIILKY